MDKDPIYIHRPTGPIMTVDRWILEEILTEAKRSGNLDENHLIAIQAMRTHFRYT